MSINNYKFVSEQIKNNQDRECKITDWLIDIKLSSTTFKGANNSCAAQLPNGENLYFDKFALSMTLQGLTGLLKNSEFHEFLANCKKLFAAQQEGRPLLLSSSDNTNDVSEEDATEEDGTDISAAKKKPRLLDDYDEEGNK